MSTYSYITGSSTAYSASVPIPVSGTLLTAASVNEGFRTLADRTANLEKRTEKLYNRVGESISSDTVSRQIPITVFNCSGSATGALIWTPDSNGFPTQITQSSLAANNKVWFSLESLPNKAQLTEVKVRLSPASGHSGLPASGMPRLTMFRYNENGTGTSVFDVVDVSANVAAYEASHTITTSLGTAGHYIDKDTYDYRLCVQGEWGTVGTTFQPGLKVYSVVASYGFPSGSYGS
jgi:hypothetical protein